MAAVDTGDFIRRVFNWMGFALLLTSATAWYVANTPSVVNALTNNVFLYLGLVVVELGVVIYLSARIAKMSVMTATLAFLAYAILNGVTVSVILLGYTGASVAGTFLVTAGTFIATAWLGYITKRDLSAMGSLLMMGLIGLILGSVVNIFLNSDAFSWVLTYLGVAIFVGLTAYDMQKIKRLASSSMASDMSSKMAVIGALALYLDFVNLFLYLLRIFGKRRK